MAAVARSVVGPQQAGTDWFRLWELRQEWQEITSSHPLSSIIGGTWGNICQWYNSLDKTEIQALQHKVSKWAPTEPQEKKIQEAVVRIFGYLRQPGIDSKEALTADVATISAIISEINKGGLAETVMADPDCLSSAAS